MPGAEPDLTSRLGATDLLAGVPETVVRDLAASMTLHTVPPGTTILAAGAPADSFGILLDGTVEIRPDATVFAAGRLPRAGPGTILGELALLTGSTRRASVVAVEPVVIAVGGVDAFATLVAIPGVAGRLGELASRRLAEIAPPVRVGRVDDHDLVVRPLLPADRRRFGETLRHQPEEWLYSRFFSGGRPNDAVVEYLVNVDYVGHFAWAAGTAEPLVGLGVGRYIRLRDRPAVAELAFEITDEWRGHGIGTVLLGALGVTARLAGIERFHAETLTENRAMQRLARRAGAAWHLEPGGLLETEFPVQDACTLVPSGVADDIERVARDIVTGAGLGPHDEPTPP